MPGPLPSPGKVLKVIMTLKKGEDLFCINHLFLSYAGAASATDVQTLADLISAKWLANLAPLHPTDSTLESVEVIDLASSSGAVRFNTTSRVGTRSGPGNPAGTAAVISCKINRRYRGGKPRVYTLMGTNNDLTDAQAWSAAFITAASTGWQNFINDVTSLSPAGFGAMAYVNVSYFTGFTNHTYPSGRVKPIPNQRVTPLVDVITSVGLNPKVGSQRRRNLQTR